MGLQSYLETEDPIRPALLLDGECLASSLANGTEAATVKTIVLEITTIKTRLQLVLIILLLAQ